MGLLLVVPEDRERKIFKRFQVTTARLLAVEFTIYVLYCAVSMVTLLLVSMLFWKAAFLGLRTGGLWLLVAVIRAVTVICMEAGSTQWPCPS